MEQQRSRPYLYEIDVIRAVTALGVVGVHVAAMTVILTQSPVGILLQNGLVSALHFTREVFLAITAFVLVYGYANRPAFPVRTFWRKRGVGVLLPYVAWSLFYVWMTVPHQPFGDWLRTAVLDILTGSASYQLYYILLTIEFYLLLPWFMGVITRAARRPWRLLTISFAAQVVVLAVDYRFVQTQPFATTGIGAFINDYQNRFLPLYQFYVIFGAVAALHLRQLREFGARHGRLFVAGVGVGLALLWGTYLVQVVAWHQSILYGIAVFQPAMAFYGLAIAGFLYWISYRWATARAPAPPRGHQFWLLISNASFGIYLIHPYLLDGVLRRVVPTLPVVWPEPLRVALVWVLVAGGATAITTVFLYVPGLSRLMGRPAMLRWDAGIGGWLAARWRATSTEIGWWALSGRHALARLSPVVPLPADGPRSPVPPPAEAGAPRDAERGAEPVTGRYAE